MSESNSQGKRGPIMLALMTAIAIAIAAWNLRGKSTADPHAADIGGAGAIPAEVASRTATQHAEFARKASAIARWLSQESLPPPGTPLSAMHDQLKRRADAGDADAATRLFHEVHRCIALRRTRDLLVQVLAVGSDHPDDEAIGVIGPAQAVQFKQVGAMKAYIANNDALCEGATDAQLSGLTPLLLQAAQRGDLAALDCYVATDFDAMAGVLDHPEWIEQYRAEVPGLVESALQRGDWAIVELLEQAYSGKFDTSARGQVFGTDAAMAYGLLRLEQLGASGDFADRLAPRVAAVAKTLSTARLAAAQAWASDYYSRYFHSVFDEGEVNGANLCQINDD